MLKCYICKHLTFDSFEHLENHLIEHKFKHGCDKCDEIIIRRSEKRLHNKGHRKVICNVCCKEYESMNWRVHKQSHEFLYSLDQLTGIVDIINQMQGNQVNSVIKKPAKIEKYFGDQAICPVVNCKLKFESPNLLIDHFRNHVANHSCTFCGDIFSDGETLKKHCFENVCRFYSCPKCNKQFSFELFIKHVMEGCEPRPKNINKIHTTNAKFINRLVYVPNDVYKYLFRCYICEMEFGTLEWLEEHLIIHGKCLHLCNKCLCVFDDEFQFINHPGIYCNYADLQEFPKKIRLTLRAEVDIYLQSTTNPELTLNSVDNTIDGVSKNHLLQNPKVYITINKQVKFQCNICKLNFVEFYFLQQHYQIHEKELIVCPECLYIFETKLKFNFHYCYVAQDESKREQELRNQLKNRIDSQFRNYNHSDVNLRIHRRFKIKTRRVSYEKLSFRNLNKPDLLNRITEVIYRLERIKFRTTIKEEITNGSEQNTSSSKQSLPLPNVNDDYDLNKILPRILERRNKCLLKKDEPEEVDNEETHYIDDYIEDLEKLDYDDLKEPPAKKMRIESDSCTDSDSESDSVDFLDKFEEFIKVSSQDEIGEESGVSSNKKLKMDFD